MRRFFGLVLFVFAFLLPVSLSGQSTDFTGITVFINPGHGGNDSNDRYIPETGFWESEGNLEKGLYLRTLLQARKATVYMSRTTNYTSDDLALSAIVEMANNSGADVFISIHSNGYDGTANRPLVLFRGYDDEPVIAESKVLAQILWEKLYEKGNCWTSSAEWVKGDWTFYPDWGTQGLGVLRGLTMPGVLSEGSFHDYIPESWRLRNDNHLHHESWAMLRTLEEFENVSEETTGIVAGTVRDELTSPDYYFKPGTKDAAKPVNNVTVTLNRGEKTVITDELNNGFFLFDSLPPGNYELICSDMTDFYNDTLTAAVTANKTTLTDFLPPYDTTNVPVVTEFLPSTTDSVPFNQSFTFTFNVKMNTDSVEAALETEPEVNLLFDWSDDDKVLTVTPETGFTGKTSYTMTLTTHACSKWKVYMQTEYQVSFVTESRLKLVTEKIWPSSGLTDVNLYPRITIWFDAPLDQSTASEKIRLIDSQSSAISKIRESFTTTDGKGIYTFEPSDALHPNSVYRIVMDADLTDIAGATLGTASETEFTTRTDSYQTGTVVESFDVISKFWDPEDSGSTTGTNDGSTTFTPSVTIYRSGMTSGKLSYLFTGSSGGVCRVFDTNKPGIGNNTSQLFAIWVYGDLSYNKLEYWFYSTGTVNQIVLASTIDWAGWDLISVPVSSIGGTGEWQFHSVVIRQTTDGELSGTMYFDDAMVITPTDVEKINDTETEMLIFPNPVTSEGKVSFTVETPSYVVLDLYSSNGSLVTSLFSGYCESGQQTIEWTPPANIVSGLYTLRLSIRKEGETGWKEASGKLIIIKQ